MAAPPNGTCGNAIDIPTLPSFITVDTTEAVADPTSSDDDCGTGDSDNAVWYKWTGTAIPKAQVTLEDDDFNGVVTIFKGSCGALVYVDCSYSGNDPLIFDVEEGVVYYFLLTSYDPAGIPALEFTLEVAEPVGDICITVDCAVPPPTLTYLWTQVSGPCTAVFSDDEILNPTVTFPCPGVYVLRLTATSECSSISDEVTITVLAACVLPSASPFPDL